MNSQERKYEEASNRARNKIKSCRKLDLILKTSLKLNDIEDDISAWSKMNPYALMLMIRWAFQYGERNGEIKNLTINNLNSIYNDCAYVCCSADYLNNGEYLKFLRKLSFQQFWFQKRLRKGTLGRLLLLFCKQKGRIQQNFIEKIGMNMQDYFIISCSLWIWARQNKDILLPRNFFENDDLINQYASKTLEEMSQYMLSYSKIKNPYLQTFEQTPLVKYPFLKTSRGLLRYSKRILEEHIRTIFYRVMKDAPEQNLVNKEFSPIFEKYIERLLQYTGLTFFNEEQLRNKVGKEKKVTDFAIEFENMTILIEAKAIELSHLARVMPEDSTMKNSLSDSIGKAVVQAYELIDSLKENDNKNYALLIVTYDDLFLGPPEGVWREFLGVEVEEYFKNSEKLNIKKLPPGKIFEISIDELEMILAVVKHENLNLPSFIEEAFLNNMQKDTIAHQLSMHLKQKEVYEIDFLKKEFENFLDNTLGTVKR